MKREEIVIEDRSMEALLATNAGLERLWTGAKWAEGPVYFHEDDALAWSDVPNNRMFKWTRRDGARIFRAPSQFANGNYRDLQGRLVTCEHLGRRISRTEPDGNVVTLVGHFDGKRLNSPNDVTVRTDGTIWFSDPNYGIMSNNEGYMAPSEVGANNVYRFDPGSGEVSVVADDFEKPNGLAFSPNADKLYISDSSRSHDPDGKHHIRVFDVVDGRHLKNGRVFAVIEPGIPDGFRIDRHGNVFTSAGDGIQVYSEAGKLLGRILVPEAVSNCTFGGPQKNRLFITATSSVYAIDVGTTGL
ncbi:MAG: SMP-30/gluconolactonase/LRE family protein [Gammaproteobacteria bacterium]|nr:SMP-30/gluconolactonase/LRE family protein [Gammaproteobacteria bacterium]